MTERMEYNMRQSVFFDKFIESTVNHLAFHRTAIAGAKDQVIVIALSIALELFLSEYLLYHYDHDEPFDESEE